MSGPLKTLTKKKKKKKRSRRQLLADKAWKLISVFVRSKNATFGGQNKCYTCEKWFDWKYELQAGHYIHGTLDYDERNLKPQCTRCNKWLSGNLGIYGEKLHMEYGSEWVAQLRRDATQKGNNYSVSELEEIIKKYE